MTDSKGPDGIDDVTEAVGAEWVAQTTPQERVRAVIRHSYTPRSAEAIAADAQTSPKTARRHLNSLSNEGYVTTEPGESGGTQYRRSPESLVVEQAADILEHVSVEELVSRVSEMREQLSDYQSEYGVESPEELAIFQTNQTLSDGAVEHEEVDAETVRDWQTTRRNLAFANAALSIAHAERFVDESDSSDGGVPAH